MTLILGIIYPLFITLFAQLLFPFQANGSLVKMNGKVIGSELIGQKSDSSEYFQNRPSATNYETLPSGGSNLGLTNRKLHELAESRKSEFIKQNQLSINQQVPSEMVFASASGLDPDISPQAAVLQVNRIVRIRNLSAKQKENLYKLINKLTENPQFGIFGEPRVNIFMLNLGLDKIAKK